MLYHLLVLLRAAEVPLRRVMAELERRTAQSGLAEKAAGKTPSMAKRRGDASAPYHHFTKAEWAACAPTSR